MWARYSALRLRGLFLVVLLVLFPVYSYNQVLPQTKPITMGNLLDDLDLEIANLAKTIKNLEQQKIALTVQIESLNKELSLSKELSLTYKTQIDSLRSDLLVLQALLVQYQQQLQTLTENYSKQNLQLTELQLLVKDLEKSTQKVQDLLNEKQKEINVLKSEIKWEKTFGWIKSLIAFFIGLLVYYGIDKIIKI